jgi:hypothetical protein
MMTGIGTPSSHNKIPRPITVLLKCPSRQWIGRLKVP